MQRVLQLKFLLLFLTLVFCVSLISFSSIDFDGSKLHFVTASDVTDLGNNRFLMVTILPSDSRVCIRFRQLVLQEVGHQSPLISGMAPKRRISARLKSIMSLGDSGGLGQFDEGLSSNSANCHKKQHGHARAVTEPFPQYSESGNRIGDDIIENVFFCGQASYEDIRRGVAVQYVDHGDDMYRCESCGAQFWLEESLKGASRNSHIIYTGCCKKGLVKLQDKHQQFLMNY